LITYDPPAEASLRGKVEGFDILETKNHRAEVLHRQHSEKKENQYVQMILPGTINAVMDDLDALLTLLDRIVPVCALHTCSSS
jgi:hypothetical protein